MSIRNALSCLVAGFLLVVGTVSSAAGRGERRPLPEYIAEVLQDMTLAEALLQPHSPARQAIEVGRIEEAREMLMFQPLDEAPLPEGFPGYTPVGVIEVKEYPAYRKATGPSFFPLFRHIKKQSIPMTAPVEMTSQADRDAKRPMAFLYKNTSVGSTGPVDGVQVQDTPATVVVSIGMRGSRSKKNAARALAALEAWLSDQVEWKRAEGQLNRVYAYNSPMVPTAQRYWELQIVLEPAAVP